MLLCPYVYYLFNLRYCCYPEFILIMINGKALNRFLTTAAAYLSSAST